MKSRITTVSVKPQKYNLGSKRNTRISLEK